MLELPVSLFRYWYLISFYALIKLGVFYVSVCFETTAAHVIDTISSLGESAELNTPLPFPFAVNLWEN